MLTMTVMQHERGALGGLSKDTVEDKEDVLSCLRHLHRTLQECHWRVQTVDHALSAQGTKGLAGPQKQDGSGLAGSQKQDGPGDTQKQEGSGLGGPHKQEGSGLIFQYGEGKEFCFQNQPEFHNHKKKAMKDKSLQTEAGKNGSLQDKAEKTQNLEDQSTKKKEETQENDDKDNSEENHNHQNEIKEKFLPENLSSKDLSHPQPAQEKNSSQSIRGEETFLPLLDEGNNDIDLCSDSKENIPCQPTKDSDLENAATKDCTECHDSRPDYHDTRSDHHDSRYNHCDSRPEYHDTRPDHHYSRHNCRDSRPDLHDYRLERDIQNQSNDEESFSGSKVRTHNLDCTNLQKKQGKSLVRQYSIDKVDAAPVDKDDSTPVDSCTVNDSVDPQYVFEESSVSTTSGVFQEDSQHQILGQNMEYSDKVAKELSYKNYSRSSEVRCRAGHKEVSFISDSVNEGEEGLLTNQKITDPSLEDQKEDKTTNIKGNVGKVSLAEAFPEVTQKMDVIWEALQSLQSHFLALHSSVVHSSSHCLNQELCASLGNYDGTLWKVKRAAAPLDVCEEHSECEDKSDMSSDIAHPSQSFSKHSSYKKTLVTKLSPPVCCSLSENCTRSCTLHKQPINEASSSNTAYSGTFFRGWRGGCLFTVMVLLLLVLLLFLASCLLIVLPVVRVSVRTSGGLPAV